MMRPWRGLPSKLARVTRIGFLGLNSCGSYRLHGSTSLRWSDGGKELFMLACPGLWMGHHNDDPGRS